MKAEIITIGDELLIGQVVDTNAAWIARECNLAGIEICRITSVPDSRQPILEALVHAGEHADLVILTGGLGPTRDDRTKKVLCGYFDTRLVFHQPTFEEIKERFKQRNIAMTPLNRDQALIPEACTVLPNKMGTAPGLWFEKNNTVFVAVPGVPYEMKYLITEQVLPRLREKGKTKAIYHRTVLTQGIAESVLAEKLEEWEDNLPEGVRMAYLPSPLVVRLRLSMVGEDLQRVKKVVEEEIRKLMKYIPGYIFGYDEDQLAGVTGRMLAEKNQTLAVAESCTGGYLSHLITSIPGSSVYFKGSVTAYANTIKQDLLGVRKESLETFGAVSRQVAEEMVMGVKERFKVDYAVATTGIAGPGGGTPEKPVGTVWIAVAGPGKRYAYNYVFAGDERERNIIRSSQTALQLLRRMILKEL
jgi:nicotinamide-nucleotide amidase